MADKSFGVKQINLIGASGTPTIESPNNLNLNANTVAISTDVTIGSQVQSNLRIGSPYFVGIGTTTSSSKLDVIGNVRVTGVSTLGTGVTVNGTTFTNQLSVSGFSTFAGITTVTGQTLFAKQLNVSGVSTFTYIRNTGITSTKDLIISGTGNDAGSISTISLRSRNNYIDFDVALPVSSPPQQFGIKFQGATILGGSYSFPSGSVSLNNWNGTTALSINDSGLTLATNTFVGSAITMYASTGIVSATSFSGSGAMQSRTVVSGLTTSIVNNGIGNTNITGFKSYALLRVGLSTAAWLRLYTDSTSRANDASRSIGIDPTPGSGVIAEVVTTGISTTQIITPFTIGGNLDTPVSSTIYAAITNLSGSTQAINAQLTILQLEV